MVTRSSRSQELEGKVEYNIQNGKVSLSIKARGLQSSKIT